MTTHHPAPRLTRRPWREQHLEGSLAAPPALLLDAQEAVATEAWWLEFGWWEGQSVCQEAVDEANGCLRALILRLE